MQSPQFPRQSSLLAPIAAGLLAAAAATAGACGSGNGGNTGGTGGTTASSSSSTTSSSSSTGGTGGTGGQGTGGRPSDPPIDVSLQGRPYDLKVPTGYDGSTPAPLLLELHGFTDASNSMTPWDDEESANQFAPEADKRGIFLALPHGTLDPVLNRFFWNATDSCCDLDKIGTNDIGYILAVVQDIESKYKIDPKRIFIFGHSNGGFMANRVACDAADKFAGAVSLAGATYKDQTKCAASAPIAYLQVHGDADMVVPYAGGHPENISILPVAPGAIETTQDWAKKNRCDIKADTSTPPFDIVADLDGNETTALKFQNCEANGHTELWTMHLGPHSPKFNSSWAPMVLDYLMAHPKP
jgi:polyhydroxybutyrate depolymerase